MSTNINVQVLLQQELLFCLSRNLKLFWLPLNNLIIGNIGQLYEELIFGSSKVKLRQKVKVLLYFYP
jgi:hypothetical protein